MSKFSEWVDDVKAQWPAFIVAAVFIAPTCWFFSKAQHGAQIEFLKDRVGVLDQRISELNGQVAALNTRIAALDNYKDTVIAENIVSIDVASLHTPSSSKAVITMQDPTP